uniref:Uncharacterized protein n=1 Tax=Cacopsylla melanoneura TaxID=428564 RepID=A0A8D8ZBY3_9HEMI
MKIVVLILKREIHFKQRWAWILPERVSLPPVGTSTDQLFFRNHSSLFLLIIAEIMLIILQRYIYHVVRVTEYCTDALKYELGSSLHWFKTLNRHFFRVHYSYY